MKYCPNCGAQIEDTLAVCPKCGAPVTAPAYQPKPKAPNSTSAFVCSLVGFIVPFVGIILCPIGLVLSSKGRRAIAHNPQGYAGNGLLIAAMVLGILGIVYSVGLILLTIVSGALIGGSLSLIDMI